MSYIYGPTPKNPDHPFFADDYFNAFMRMDVYFAGLLFGLWLRNCKDSPDQGKILTRQNLVIGWIVCVFLMVGAVYGPYRLYNHQLPQERLPSYCLFTH